MKLIQDLGMVENSVGNKVRKGIYQCPQCNSTHERTAANIRRQKSGVCISCSGSNNKKTHGLYNNKSYKTWANIKDRCYNKNANSYRNYGARGITVCNEWLDVKVFDKWFNKNYIDGYEIDRIDNNGNYSPENCRFISSSDNCKNTRRNSEKQSKYRYVTYRKANDKWVGTIPISKKRKIDKQIYLGSFNTEEEAHIRVENKLKEMEMIT